jgi:hypothetical protein
MHKYERRQLRTTIRDLDPDQTIRPLADRDLLMVTGGGGISNATAGQTTNNHGAGSTDDIPVVM